MTLADKLKMLRKEKKCRQEDVAKALNISRGTYLYYEKGERYPKKEETYKKLAEFFGVPADELLSLRDDRVRIVVKDPNLTAKERRDLKDFKSMMAGFKLPAAGGEIDTEDMDLIMETMEEMFWDAKGKASEKFTPKKYKR